MSMKNPLTPGGIEPAIFRFVAKHLNHCATAVPTATRVSRDTSILLLRKPKIPSRYLQKPPFDCVLILLQQIHTFANYFPSTWGLFIRRTNLPRTLQTTKLEEIYWIKYFPELHKLLKGERRNMHRRKEEDTQVRNTRSDKKKRKRTSSSFSTTC